MGHSILSLHVSPSPSSLSLPNTAKETKFRLNLSPGAWERDSGCNSSPAFCYLQSQSSLHPFRLSSDSASVPSPQGEFANPCWKHFVFHCNSTGVKLVGVFVTSLLCSFPASAVLMEEKLRRQPQNAACVGSHKLPWSLNVYSWITSLSILLSSVNFDGIFPQFQKLEKLVFRPLLQGHQGSCFLLQILIDGKNDLRSLLCFLVPRVFEKSL